MLSSIKTYIKHYLDVLLFGAFILLLAMTMLEMNRVAVRSLDDLNGAAAGQVPRSEMPSQFPIYLPSIFQ